MSNVKDASAELPRKMIIFTKKTFTFKLFFLILISLALVRHMHTKYAISNDSVYYNCLEQHSSFTLWVVD